MGVDEVRRIMPYGPERRPTSGSRGFLGRSLPPGSQTAHELVRLPARLAASDRLVCTPKRRDIVTSTSAGKNELGASFRRGVRHKCNDLDAIGSAGSAAFGGGESAAGVGND